jgi:phage gpG-like protein
METNVTFNVNTNSIVDFITGRGKTIYMQVRAAVIEQQLRLFQLVQSKLSDDVLHVRTGNLRRSIINMPVQASDTEISGRVASDGSVAYGAIHEYGGMIHHPGGTAYMFFGDEGVRFISNAAAAKMEAILGRTKPHNIPIPERSFMRSALRERTPAIVMALEEATKTNG